MHDVSISPTCHLRPRSKTVSESGTGAAGAAAATTAAATTAAAAAAATTPPPPPPPTSLAVESRAAPFDDRAQKQPRASFNYCLNLTVREKVQLRLE